MENDYLKYQLGAVAQAVSNIDKYSAGIKNSICVILGYLKANDDFTAPTFGNGYDNLVEELKLLIINLNIKARYENVQTGSSNCEPKLSALFTDVPNPKSSKSSTKR